MTGFAADWLALREPADAQARDATLRDAFVNAVNAATDAVITDLGCGTGSTHRALAGLLHPPRAWRLTDHDAALLDAARSCKGATVHRLDLNDLDALPVATGGFVTASALFDLCSEDFAHRLFRRLPVRGVYAALNYDGRMAWSIPHPQDAAVTAAFNRHQQGDKGFGPAMGPDAGAGLRRAAMAAGYAVQTADSPWRLGPSGLQDELLRGIAAAAAETGLPCDDWLAFRRSATGTCRIGHTDVLALRPTADQAFSTLRNDSSIRPPHHA